MPFLILFWNLKIILPNHHLLHYQSLRIPSLLRVLAASCVIPSSLRPRSSPFLLHLRRCVFPRKGFLGPLRPFRNNSIFVYGLSIVLSPTSVLFLLPMHSATDSCCLTEIPLPARVVAVLTLVSLTLLKSWFYNSFWWRPQRVH